MTATVEQFTLILSWTINTFILFVSMLDSIQIYAGKSIVDIFLMFGYMYVGFNFIGRIVNKRYKNKEEEDNKV